MKIRSFFKISFIASLFVFFSACSQDDFDPDKSANPAEKVSVSRQVTKEQALKFSEKAIQAMFSSDDTPLDRSGSNLKSTLKSSKSVDKKIQEVYTDDGKVAMYVINFGNDEGYMIVSGDKESSSYMLAFNDVGSLDLSSLDKNSTMALWLEEKRQIISEDFQTEESPDAESYEMWDGLSSKDGDVEIELELLSYRPSKEGEPTLKGRHKGSWGLAGQGVGYQVYNNLWGQGTGYNADAPLVGCPAVAVGMLCRYYRFPSKYDYVNMPQKLNTSSSNAISRMFRNIADNIPGYSWGYRSSGAKGPDILTGLKKLGYTQAKYSGYNFNTAYANIEKNRPVLLCGFQNDQGAGGHIWIADGYWEQTWKVTRKFAGIKVKSWYEYVDMLYMNWGWNGTGNGWIDQADWNSGSGSFNYGRQMFHDVYPIY